MSMDVNTKLSTSRLYAIEQFPYFASALLALVPRQMDALDTFAVTDTGFLLWSAPAVERWSIEEIAAVLVHEVGHWIREHAARRVACGAEPQLWNIAADAEINDDIAAANLTLPEQPIFPSTFGCKDGLCAEEYYGALQQKQQQGGGGGKQGAGQGKGKGQGQGDGSVPDPSKPAAGGGWCGSGGGHAVPGEPEGSDPQARSDIDRQSIKREVAQAIRNHKAQKGRGSIPGSWDRWAEEQLQPAKIRWQDKLAVFARNAVAYRAGMGDYTLTRPSRRQAALGWGDGIARLHAMHSPRPNVAIAIDTSGSMGSAELLRAASESASIIKTLGLPVSFISVDAAVHAAKQVRNVSQLVEAMKGGGGTDFRPAFECLKFLKARPDVLIFITDGQGPAPTHPPKGVKVIWVLVGPHRCVPYSGDGQGHINWGEVVEIDDNDEAEQEAA